MATQVGTSISGWSKSCDSSWRMASRRITARERVFSFTAYATISSRPRSSNANAAAARAASVAKPLAPAPAAQAPADLDGGHEGRLERRLVQSP